MRDKKIQIRVTDDEYTQLQQKKTTSHLAQWMREFCLSSKVKRFRKSADPVLLRMLSAVLGLLIIIARKVNSHNKPFDSIPILAIMVSIETHLNAIRNNYDKHI